MSALGYVLPIKRAIRTAEGPGTGDVASVMVVLIDPCDPCDPWAGPAGGAR